MLTNMMGINAYWLTLVLAILILGWLLSHLWLTPLARLAQAFERHAGGLHERRSQHDGVDWHYLEGGHGETLVLLHGFNGDAYHFARTARHLKKHFRIIAPDLPGFGETECDETISHRIEDIAQRLLAWLDHQKIDHFYLGGNSMGGYISTAMARLAPDRVRALWLLAPGGVRTAPLSAVLQEVSEDRHNPLVVRDYADFKRLLSYCFVNPPWTPKPLLRFLARRASQTSQRSLGIFDAMLNDSAPLETMADGLKTPALIVWGKSDQVLHYQGGQIIQNLMPSAHLIVMPKIGHLPMLEAPKETAEAWLAFTETQARQSISESGH